MEYISVIQFAEKYGISERTARNYCANGKIEGAFLTGKTWNIPVDATLPKRGAGKHQLSPLLKTLREQKASKEGAMVPGTFVPHYMLMPNTLDVLSELVAMVSRNMMYRCSKATNIARTVVSVLIYLSGIY